MISSLNRLIKEYVMIPLIDTLYPPLCHHCNKLLPRGRQIICQNCWKEIPPFSGELDESLLNRTFDNVYILFKYEEIIQMLIHLLKYNRYLSLTHYFAEESFARFPILKNKRYDAIIPVPLHKIRKRERGYNQSEEIARALSDKLKIPVKSELLQRHRNTTSQTTMSRVERDQNVKDAFNCPSRVVQDVVLLIDDVITTGSTVEACVICLKDAGVKEVDILTLAHPPPERL